MFKIFISYRREDSGDAAGRIGDQLQARFGRGNVFLDVDSLRCGLDFPQQLAEAVGRCDVLLAVIGEHWLEVRYAEGPKQGQRRLDDPADFVRIEIQSALARDIRVVPVLIGKASMPRAEELPDDLKKLAFRHAAEVRPGRDFHAHVDQLVRSLGSRRRPWLWAGACGLVLLLGLAVLLFWRGRREPTPLTIQKPDGAKQGPPADNRTSQNPNDPSRTGPIRYRGRVDVWLRSRDSGSRKFIRLNEAGTLPLRQDDRFQVVCEVNPPAYLYVLWVDPGHDVTPIYPWDPRRKGDEKWKSRPAKEERVERLNLPNKHDYFRFTSATQPGVATMVMFARAKPLDVPDKVVRQWFAELPDLPLPPGGEQAVVWFDNYAEARDQDRTRTLEVVGGDDPFAKWQARLEKVLGDKAAFQTAVSFARTGGK